MELRFLSSMRSPKRVVFFLADRDIDVAAQLSFFHIGIGDVAVDEDLLEGLDVGEGFFG